MLHGLALPEGREIEWLRLPAVLSLDQVGADGFGPGAAFLFAPDKVPDRFAAIDIMPRVNLGLDPAVLLASQGDGLAYGARASSGGMERMIFIISACDGEAGLNS